MKRKLGLIFICCYGMTFAQKHYPPIPFDSTLYKAKKEYLNTPKDKNKSKMNVLLIVADDLGKFDISLYGNPYIKTPHIDQLGEQGITFNTGYSTAAVCSPSRAGFLTGRYQQRYGYQLQPHQHYPKNKMELWFVRHFINTGDLVPNKEILSPSKIEMKKEGLPSSEISIADVLKHNGYRTAQIGKWNLGYYEPSLAHDFGFDYTYGFNEAYSLYADPKDPQIVNAHIKEFTDKVIWRGGRKNFSAIYENGKKIDEKEYLTYAIVDHAKKFIGTNNKKPFFVYLPFNAPHTPYQAPKAIYDSLSSIKNHNLRVYYSMVVALDKAVGQLVDFLKETHQYKNTLIIFTSDNGAALYSKTVTNKPLNGGKFTLFEGGINIPFLLSNPILIKHPLRVEEPVSLLDIFPTIAAATHSKLPSKRQYDGISLLPIMEGDTLAQKRKAFYWYSDYNSAIRVGDFKLILNDYDHTVDVFNLKKDPYELHTISSDTTEIKKLKTQLSIWKALMPHLYWPRIMNYTLKINGKIYHWAV